MTGRKVRTKKLGVKTPLPVLRESEIDQSEYHSLVSETQIATGVEQAEEKEFHLQTILKGAGTSNDQEIPVPPPQLSDHVFEELYLAPWEEPKSYIRSSATVEECITGAAYDMTREDDEFLTKHNAALAAADRLIEDAFEAIMDVFESMASEQAPNASVDNIVAYEHMVPSLSIIKLPAVMHHTQAVYDYWRSRRSEAGNRPLHPTLKFEVHQETDEADPYVCFRRREARQTRKTRARDVQMTEKLKRLRRELEDGRQLIVDTYERETMKRAYLNLDRDIFEQRARLREMKVRLGIRTEDEDLYNHKPPKRKAPEPSAPASRLQLRLPARPDARAVESDLVLLSDEFADKENLFRREVAKMQQAHRMANKNYVDVSLAPLSPLRESAGESKFRAAVAAEYLVSPPASTSDAMDLDESEDDDAYLRVVRFPTGGDSSAPTPRYRRRIGRAGRMWIDRRDMAARPNWSEGGRAAGDQWRFDDDDGDEDEPPVYELDPFSDAALQWRFKALGLPRPIHFLGARRPLPNASAVSEASAAYQRAVAGGGGTEPSSRQGRIAMGQQLNGGSGLAGSHTRATLVPAPMQTHGGARQLTKMAPPVLPHAQKV